MKVGDLVKVGPSFDNLYIVTSLEAQDTFQRKLPKCVMLVCLDNQSPAGAMNKKWIKIISKAPKKRTKKKEST